MRQKIILLSLVFFLLFSCTAFAKTKKQDLIAEIVLEKSNFMISEPIDVTIHLTNISNKDINYIIPNISKYYGFGVDNVEPSDGAVLYNPYNSEGGLTQLFLIKAGGQYSYELTLNKYISFNRTEDYKIVVNNTVEILSAGSNISTYLNTRKEINISITKDNNDAIDAILDRVYQKATDEKSNYADRNKEIEKIVYMRTKRAAPYLKRALEGRYYELRYPAVEGLSMINDEIAMEILRGNVNKVEDIELKEIIVDVLKKHDENKKDK